MEDTKDAIDRFVVRDRDERGVLAFDLVDLLHALGDFTERSEWRISPSGLDCVGEASNAFEEIADSGTRISGPQLKVLASQISQVIDGEFRGYLSNEQPEIVLLAVDSSEWEVSAKDLHLAKTLRERFSNVVDVRSS